ncbi:unnamed protein product [Prorocentrum cordatum]|uniref:peptidylprolyl isomerase n=1 Tax=Prorocentrum cordatum TaxID=2364126 RepID=A0ABN9QEU3_9DINO|nr:unnamed protein product [Polarella glacialis]
MADQLNTQAFWNDFLRRPDARAAYQADRKLQIKKSEWLKERDELEEFGNRRKVLADELEAAPADLKKLIAPMFHIKMVQQFLWMIQDCQKHKKESIGGLGGPAFLEKLQDEGTQDHLRKLRTNFQEGGEERMQQLQDNWYGICNEIHQDNQKQADDKPRVCSDITTLKHILEYGQEAKRLGNEKFKEGLYDDALFIYGQGDDMMKKFTVGKHLKNESKWYKEHHIACLKNKAQAALKLEKWHTALEAAEAAIDLDPNDHKAWFRKVLALKGIGRFKEAEEALLKVEEAANWNCDRVQILKDCEAERKKIHLAAAKHKVSTKDMLGKAFEAGIFGGKREKELEDANRIAAKVLPPNLNSMLEVDRPAKSGEAARPVERNVTLTAELAGHLVDQLADAYGEPWFQERVRKCARDSLYQRSAFVPRLASIALEVQRPILERWGFEGSPHGVKEMTVAIRECAHDGSSAGQAMPEWLKAKQDRCLELLYGGREEGMAGVMMGS